MSERDFMELVKSVRSIRILLNLSLVILLLFIVFLNAFMLSQIRTMRREAGRLQPAVQEMQKTVADYETNAVPVMQRFTTELRRFAERNPDFLPVLNRYPGVLLGGRPTNAPPQGPGNAPNTGR